MSPVLHPVTTSAEQSIGLHLVIPALLYFLFLWKQNATAQTIFKKKILNYSACLRLQDKSDFNFSVKISSTIENPSVKTPSNLQGILHSCTETTVWNEKLRLLHFFMSYYSATDLNNRESPFEMLSSMLLSYTGDKLGKGCSNFLNIIWWMFPYLCLPWVIVTELN